MKSPRPPITNARRSASAARVRRENGSAIPSARHLEFRVEAFNALNHPSFGPPARDISAPNSFGVITNTISSSRVIELALKFYF